jgi:NADH-quinone oxidoreductase subunit J
MSVLELVLDPGFLALVMVSAVAVISSLLIVVHKSLVYSAFFLGVLGISNAVLFALLGFTFIALFQVAVYIGAAVTFFLFSVTLFEKVPVVERRIRIVIIAAVLSTIVLLAGIFGTYFGGTTQATEVNFRELTSLLAGKYWFALIIAALTLITTLIEAITLARIER